MADKLVGHVSSGLLLLVSPAFLKIIPFEFNFKLEAQAIITVYGLILLLAGMMSRGAKYFQWTVSMASMAGLLLFLLGPMSFYPLGYELWRIFGYTTLFTLGITSLALVYLTRI